MSGLLRLVVLIAVLAAMSALWSALSIYNGQVNGWMALITALDAVLLIRLTGARRGWGVMLMVFTTTLLTAACSLWVASATRIGRAMGMSPMDSLQRMDPQLSWEITRQSASPWDWLALAIALLVAFWLLRPIAQDR